MNASLQPYLAASRHIDADHPEVMAAARRLAQGRGTQEDVVRACFAFVRDQVRHSADYRCNPVTVHASEVLRHATGFCYAKSHLLAALLRANGIPAGLCYQRLATGDAAAPYCLHGLNAVYLAQHGWYRLDPRGDKPGVQAGFAPPREMLPFRADGPGEGDLPGIFAEPLPVVIAALARCATYEQVLAALPDSALPA